MLQSVINFVLANKAFLSTLAGLIISEVMALNPSSKFNGILDFIKGLLKKQEAPKAPAA